MVSHTNAIFRLPEDVTVNLPVGRLTLGGRVSKRCSAQLKGERKSSSPDITHTLHKLQHSIISLDLKKNTSNQQPGVNISPLISSESAQLGPEFAKASLTCFTDLS